MEHFDPYYTWLGIKPKDQPPNHYRLLGIDLFEQDPTVIEHATDQRMAHIRTFGAGKHGATSQKILNEISSARLCLLQADHKANYDAQLRAAIAPAAAPRAARIKPTEPHPVAAAAPKIKQTEPQYAAARLRRRPSRPIPPVILLLGGVAAVVVLLAIVAAAYFALKDRDEVADRGADVSELINDPEPVPWGEEKPVAQNESEPPDSDVPPPGASSTIIDVPKTEEPPSTPDAEDGPPTTSQEEGEGEEGADGSDERQVVDAPPQVVDEPEGPPQVVGEPEGPPQVVGEPEVPPAVARPRSPVPDETARSLARSKIHSLYKEEFRLARRPVAKVDLAKEFMAASGTTGADPASAYALLMEARILATEAGDAGLAMSIAEALAERFDVDEWTMKSDVVKKTSAAAKTLAERGTVYKAAVKLAEEAAEAEAYDVAIDLLGIAERLAQRAREHALAKECRTRKRVLGDEKEQWELSRQARTKLAEDPNNPGANRALGLFLCFVQDDWEQGLPLLLKANDSDLKAVLARESDRPTDAPRQAHLGDLWWDTVRGADGVEKQQFTARACYWYRQAVVGLDGTERTRIEKLLQRYDPIWGQVAVGLVGHWQLDDGKPESALDGTGSQHGKYVGSLVWSREAGRVVAVFDAKTTGVVLGRRDFGNAFTIAVWIKPRGSSSSPHYCVFANEYVRNDLAGIRLRVACDNNTHGHLFLETNNGKNKSATTPRGVLRLGQWHHLAVLVNRAAGTASIYVNGSDVTENSEIWRDFKNTSERWWIGAARGMYDSHLFHGSMSDFRLYNRLLSSSEISALARMGDAYRNAGAPSR